MFYGLAPPVQKLHSADEVKYFYLKSQKHTNNLSLPHRPCRSKSHGINGTIDSLRLPSFREDSLRSLRQRFSIVRTFHNIVWRFTAPYHRGHSLLRCWSWKETGRDYHWGFHRSYCWHGKDSVITLKRIEQFQTTTVPATTTILSDAIGSSTAVAALETTTSAGTTVIGTTTGVEAELTVSDVIDAHTYECVYSDQHNDNNASSSSWIDNDNCYNDGRCYCNEHYIIIHCIPDDKCSYSHNEAPQSIYAWSS